MEMKQAWMHSGNDKLALQWTPQNHRYKGRPKNTSESNG